MKDQHGARRCGTCALRSQYETSKTGPRGAKKRCPTGPRFEAGTAAGAVLAQTRRDRQTMTLITKLLTNPLPQSQSTADSGDQSPASESVHLTGRLSMAWKSQPMIQIRSAASAAAFHRLAVARCSGIAMSCPCTSMSMDFAAGEADVVLA